MSEFKQLSHLNPALTTLTIGPSHSNDLIGRWVNTESNTRGVAECVIEQRDGLFVIGVVGVDAEAPIIWPQVPGELLANLDEEGGQRGVALSATIEFRFMKSEIYIRLNRGVLVVVFYNTFLDDSGRANYVTREFFRRSN